MMKKQMKGHLTGAGFSVTDNLKPKTVATTVKKPMGMKGGTPKGPKIGSGC